MNDKSREANVNDLIYALVNGVVIRWIFLDTCVYNTQEVVTGCSWRCLGCDHIYELSIWRHKGHVHRATIRNISYRQINPGQYINRSWVLTFMSLSARSNLRTNPSSFRSPKGFSDKSTLLDRDIWSIPTLKSTWRRSWWCSGRWTMTIRKLNKTVFNK